MLFEEEETLEVGEEVGDSLASDVGEAPALVVPLTVTFRVMCVQVTVVCFSLIFPSKSAVFATHAFKSLINQDGSHRSKSEL